MSCAVVALVLPQCAMSSQACSWGGGLVRPGAAAQTGSPWCPPHSLQAARCDTGWGYLGIERGDAGVAKRLRARGRQRLPRHLDIVQLLWFRLALGWVFAFSEVYAAQCWGVLLSGAAPAVPGGAAIRRSVLHRALLPYRLPKGNSGFAARESLQ